MTSSIPGLHYYYPTDPTHTPQAIEADLCIYGGTPGALAAAIQARRMGKSAVIAEFGRHLGGMTAGGLGATDIGNSDAIQGISRDFYNKLAEHYGEPAPYWYMEPHVAERFFEEMAQEAQAAVYFDQHLASVTKDGNHITAITMANGNVFRAKMFIDATYEGDLLAMAGVDYHVGREANSVYNETLNGIQWTSPNHDFKKPIDPYIVPGDPSSGLLPEIEDAPMGAAGEGDARVQAYNFRMCLSNVAENHLPFPKPVGYDPARYELLRRTIEAGAYEIFGHPKPMPNGKSDTNNKGAFSTDYIGGSDLWPEADYATRERIFQEHVNYVAGFFYFLSNDEKLPAAVRDQMREWALSKDEFTTTGGWPHQLYVREGRRMISDYVMTEHNCRGEEVCDDSIGLAAYTMDSHNCKRVVVKAGSEAAFSDTMDSVRNEGNVEAYGFPPYPISYRSIVPREAECANLLITVCLSSTHIAYGSIRMEPVFMVLGQAAGTAAVLAIDEGTSVQQVKYATLRERLLADGQRLEWGGEAVGELKCN